MSRIVGTALLAVSLAACLPEEDGGTPTVDQGYRLPVYRVTNSGAGADQAQALADALGLEPGAELVRPDGALAYIDADRFIQPPSLKTEPMAASPDENGRTVTPADQVLDIEALLALTVPSDTDAIAKATALFANAGLVPENGKPAVGHTWFQVMKGDTEAANQPISTLVGWQQQLDGVKLTGPGSKILVELDSEGEVAHLHYAHRDLVQGEEVEVVPPDQALAFCEKTMGPLARTVDAELVYYAPPLDVHVGRIVPHYLCTGQDSNGEDIRAQIVPALLDTPTVDLDLQTEGASIEATAHVTGGTAPYTYAWSSSSDSLSAERDGTTVRYTARPRQPIETLTLQITDADGLVSNATVNVEVPVTTRPLDTFRGTPYGTVGTEWIGTCAGLGGSASNAGGFASRFASAGLSPQFNWGENDAWEVDFKDTEQGGQDQVMVDNVDLTFYTGHASGDGFTFCSAMNDNWLAYPDAQWGENWNLEWLVVAACGPLEDDAGAWKTRWGPSFKGLHLIMAYATVSRDNTIEGSTFANYILNPTTPRTLVDAWALTAQEVQLTGVIWATMGVFSTGYSYPNFYDYYWGMGSTGADVPAPIDYWRVYGDCL